MAVLHFLLFIPTAAILAIKGPLIQNMFPFGPVVLEKNIGVYLLMDEMDR